MRDLQARIRDELSDSPKTASELQGKLDVSWSSLCAALRPMIQGTASRPMTRGPIIPGVGCGVEVDKHGLIVHKYRLEPERSRPILVKNPPFELVHSKKDGRTRAYKLKLVSRGKRAKKGDVETPYYVRRTPVHRSN
jgi:hypothetical protein